MSCPHVSNVCDSVSGDTICTDCGLVLDSFAFASQCTWEGGFDYVVGTCHDDIPSVTYKRVARLNPHITAIAYALKLGDHIIGTAKSLAHHLISSTITIRENTMKPFAAALVYQACKLENVDRCESEFVASRLVSSKALAHANKRIRRELSQYIEHRGTNPGKLVQRFMNLLSNDFDSRTLALLRSRTEDIVREVIDTGTLEGKTPECACATCVAMAARSVCGPSSNDESFIRLMCTRCGLTYGTIINALRTLR